MKYHFWLKLRDICRDEPDPNDPGDPDPKDPKDPDPKDPGDPGKTFTQEEVNKLLAKERRDAQVKTQAKVASQLAALEAIKRDGLTPEAKLALEQQIETLRAQTQTEAELAKQSLAKAQAKWKQEEAKLTQERDAAAAALKKLKIDTALSTAMGVHGVKPEATPVISAYIQQRLQEVPEMNDAGKPTGQARLMVNLDVPDGDDGKVKTIQLTPDKAVKHLREQETFAALFSSQARSGMGGQGTTVFGSLDPTAMTQEQYMQWRKTQQR